jgi:CRISP-associated protein Cas1
MKKDFYIFSSGRLKRKDNTCYFVDSEEKKRSLPIHQIENLYLFGKVDLNTDFFILLNQYSVLVHFYNYHGFYSGTFYPRSQKVSGFTVVHQSNHYLDKNKRLFLAQQFIGSAVFHMLRNLRNYRKYSEVQNILKLIQEKSNLIETSKNIQELMGIEGVIRQLYYSAFNFFLPNQFAFDERTKRPPRDPLNALISFGNSLCYTTVLSEIYKTHLDPTISFLHEPSTKRFSLSLDIAEIFKPLLVDPVIFSLLNKKRIKETDFENLEGMVLLNDSGKKKFLQSWSEKLKTTVHHRRLKRNITYQYFIRLECYKLIKHFIEDEPYKPLKAWW